MNFSAAGLLTVGAPLLALLALPFRSTALLGIALAWALLLLAARRGARARLSGLSVRREVYGSAFEGDAVNVEVVLENRRGRAAHLIWVVDRFGPAHADQHIVLEPGPLPQRRRRRLRYQTLCSRSWGMYAVGPVALRVSDPLGLFRIQGSPGSVEPFAVYPRVYEVRALDRLAGRASLAPETLSSPRPGRGADYLGVRDYRIGDDPRRIHWPATARRGALVVREHERDLLPYFTLFLDLERSRRAGTGLKSTIEYVVRTAASLLWSAIGRGDVVQVFGEGREPLHLSPGSGQVHLAWALHELIRQRQEGPVPILEVVRRHAMEVPARSTAVIMPATTALEEWELDELIEGFHARSVRVALLAVDYDTFVPYERLAPPRRHIEARERALVQHLRSHGAQAAVLRKQHDLARELARPDLFDDPAEAEREATA